jgi:hypothetical protein
MEYHLGLEQWCAIGMEEAGLERAQVWRFREHILFGLHDPRDHRNAQAWSGMDHHAGTIAVYRLSRERHASALRWDHVLQNHCHTGQGIRLAYLLPIRHRTC